MRHKLYFFRIFKIHLSKVLQSKILIRVGISHKLKDFSNPSEHCGTNSFIYFGFVMRIQWQGNVYIGKICMDLIWKYPFFSWKRCIGTIFFSRFFCRYKCHSFVILNQLSIHLSFMPKYFIILKSCNNKTNFNPRNEFSWNQTRIHMNDGHKIRFEQFYAPKELTFWLTEEHS